MAVSFLPQLDNASGFRAPGDAAAPVALKSGGACALFGALVVMGLLVLARKLIQLAGDAHERDRSPLPPG
jgi:hypothetical protein